MDYEKRHLLNILFQCPTQQVCGRTAPTKTLLATLENIEDATGIGNKAGPAMQKTTRINVHQH